MAPAKPKRGRPARWVKASSTRQPHSGRAKVSGKMVSRTPQSPPKRKRAATMGDQKLSDPTAMASANCANRFDFIQRRSHECTPTRNSLRQESGDPLFVPHVIHVDGRVALKLAQAFNGAEIECFRMIIMASGGISNADFHFADWIDRHSRALLTTMIR